MRRQLIALRLLLSISSVSLLMPSADLSWAQNQPPIEQTGRSYLRHCRTARTCFRGHNTSAPFFRRATTDP